ncbi:MAG TPA: DUF481 domain-containing protein [Gemmatimonadaceae bacterium]|jgi:hypothetical protein|nr:DUF481 domain-containing protein [Gemmatimonadaceae bacterium]
MDSRFHAVIGAALTVAFITVTPPSAAAQGLGWNTKTEAGVSLFFGNTEQRVVTTHGNVAHADSTFEMQTDLRFSYGEASADSGRRFVNKRSWIASLSLNSWPFARFSPFFSGSIESSLEKLIHLRYNAGLGAKMSFVHNDATDANFSLALLGEKTISSGAQPAGLQTTLLRWAATAQLRHKLDEKLSINSETAYRPTAQFLAHYTFTNTTALQYQMNHNVGLSVSLVDNFDSQAMERGARSNNDGQLLFGVMTTF